MSDEQRCDASLHSSFYEKLVEHVFVSEVVQEAWFRFRRSVEVLRAEVDDAGYDLVLECNGVIRHVQLKSSRERASTSSQTVNTALAEKPSGCVVWLVRVEDENRCRVKLRYRFFGNPAGKPLPSLKGFRTGKHTKANAKGVKAERRATRRIPKGKFIELEDVSELLRRLFDVSDTFG
ncbi:MAG: hypothetical protein ABIK89_25045 [Planctomycetota bacterium]